MQQGILGYWTSQFDMNLSATPHTFGSKKIRVLGPICLVY